MRKLVKRCRKKNAKGSRLCETFVKALRRSICTLPLLALAPELALELGLGWLQALGLAPEGWGVKKDLAEPPPKKNGEEKFAEKAAGENCNAFWLQKDSKKNLTSQGDEKDTLLFNVVQLARKGPISGNSVFIVLLAKKDCLKKKEITENSEKRAKQSQKLLGKLQRKIPKI